jgi:hypothetical protein
MIDLEHFMHDMFFSQHPQVFPTALFASETIRFDGPLCGKAVRKTELSSAVVEIPLALVLGSL